jgi:hypothetical protein
MGGNPPPLCEVIMSATNVILLIVVIVIVAVVASLVIALMRRKTTPRKQAGPEYDRLVREMGPRRAQTEFARRQHRVDGLDIKPLTAGRRTAYDDQWTTAQERFIDSPLEAVRSAGALITAVAADRGYPVDDDSQLLTDLSVYHGQALDGYRRARRIAEQGEVAATEQLRQALLDQRAMFQDLLGPADDDTDNPQTPKNLASARPEQ